MENPSRIGPVSDDADEPEERIFAEIRDDLEEADKLRAHELFQGSPVEKEILRKILEPRAEAERTIAEILKEDPLRNTGKDEE